MSQHGYSPPCKVDSSGVSLEGDVTIDLLIETLTGTAFEMTVSPLDTIATIKSKIQRMEGIPVSSQHLLYNLHELEDSAQLRDCAIRDGATLRLVLNMRGGPISTRRLMHGDDQTWIDLQDLVDVNSYDEMLEHLPSSGGQLTVLVVCEGEQFNLFRVLENTDSGYSAIVDAANASSIHNVLSSNEPGDAAKRLEENTVTMTKVQELRRRLNKGTRHRKLKNSSSENQSTEETGLPSIQADSSFMFTQKTIQHLNEPLALQLPSQPALQIAAQPPPQPSALPTLKPALQTVLQSLQPPGPGALRSEIIKKTLSLPPLQVTSTAQPKMFATSSRSHQSTVPIYGLTKKERASSLNSQRTSGRMSASTLQIPSLSHCAPRPVPPPFHAPHRPPPPRPFWNQRQRPRPPVLPELKRRTLLQTTSQSCDGQLRRTPAPPCPHRCRTDPLPQILQENEFQCPSQHCSGKQDFEQQSYNLSSVDIPEESIQRHCSSGLVSNIPDLTMVSDEVRISDGSSESNCGKKVQQYQHLSSFGEHMSENLISSISQRLCARFPGIPGHLPAHLTNQLTQRLSHWFKEGPSKDEIERLAEYLTDRISERLEDILNDNLPPERLSQVFQHSLKVRRTQGSRRLERGLEVGASSAGMVMSQTATVHPSTSRSIDQQLLATESSSSPGPNKNQIAATKSLPSSSLPCPDSTLNSQSPFKIPIPRRRSTPNFHHPQEGMRRHSVVGYMQQEPLLLRLSDSSLFQRRSLPAAPSNNLSSATTATVMPDSIPAFKSKSTSTFTTSLSTPPTTPLTTPPGTPGDLSVVTPNVASGDTSVIDRSDILLNNTSVLTPLLNSASAAIRSGKVVVNPKPSENMKQKKEYPSPMAAQNPTAEPFHSSDRHALLHKLEKTSCKHFQCRDKTSDVQQSNQKPSTVSENHIEGNHQPCAEVQCSGEEQYLAEEQSISHSTQTQPQVRSQILSQVLSKMQSRVQSQIDNQSPPWRQLQGRRLKTVLLRCTVNGPPLMVDVSTQAPEGLCDAATQATNLKSSVSSLQGDKKCSSDSETKVPTKSYERCSHCRKKLGLANKYMCRCQKLFCSIHRYSEVHNCSYDYKEKGRRQLEEENPLVTAEKLAKM